MIIGTSRIGIGRIGIRSGNAALLELLTNASILERRYLEMACNANIVNVSLLELLTSADIDAYNHRELLTNASIDRLGEHVGDRELTNARRSLCFGGERDGVGNDQLVEF